MARTKGARNANYEERRRDLARRALEAFIDDNGTPRSFRAIARALETDPSTLRHYFGDADGLFRATFETLYEDARAFADDVRALLDQPPEVALLGAAQSLVEGWRIGVGHICHVAMVAGLASPVRGPIAVDTFFEPIYRLTEELVSAYADRGALIVDDPREVSWTLISPVLMALVHQDSLGGGAQHPMDIDAFCERHVRRVVGGIAPKSKPKP